MGVEASATVKDDGGVWLWPVKATKMAVTSGQGFGGSHKAIDIPATYGKTIRATRDGTVYSVQKSTAMQLGNYVVIKHKKSSNGYTYYSHYAHLSSISVKKGQTVKMGDKIGIMGETGLSDGVHLHFQITRNTSKHYGRTYPNVSINNSPVVNTNIGNIKYTLNITNTYTLKYSDGLSSTKNDSILIPPTTMTKGVSSKTTTKKFKRTGYTYNYWYIFKYVNGKANYWCSNGTTRKFVPYDNIPSGYSKVKVKHGGKLNFNASVSTGSTIYYTPVWTKK